MSTWIKFVQKQAISGSPQKGLEHYIDCFSGLGWEFQILKLFFETVSKTIWIISVAPIFGKLLKFLEKTETFLPYFW